MVLKTTKYGKCREGVAPLADSGDLQSPPIGRSGNPPRFSIKQHAQITLDSSVLEIELNTLAY